AIALQNANTDCMRLLHHFLGQRFDLRELAETAGSAPGGPYDVRLDTVEAYIRTEDLRTACEVGEFMLNLLPIPNPPLWTDLEQYVSDHFARSGGGYEYSCHQDFL